MDFGNIAAIIVACLIPFGLWYVAKKQAEMGCYKRGRE